MVPIQRIRLACGHNIDEVRKRIGTRTSEYATGLDALKFKLARNPELPFVGSAGEQYLVLTRNKRTANSGRPTLKAKLVADGDRTIIDGWMGLHTGVFIVCIVVILGAGLTQPKAWPLVAGFAFMVAFGYFVESRELLGILTRCVNNETCEGSKRSSDDD